MQALAKLAAAGFDIAHTFDAAAAAREPGLAPLAGPQRLGLLIGNTRALWPPFLAALDDPQLAGERDPLERYTERVIDDAFAGARIFYSHRRHDGAFLPMQRLAALTGLAAIAPSHLAIHPVYGPWFALRAIALLDGEPPPRAPIAPPCRCDGRCEAQFLRAQQSITEPTGWHEWVALRDCCTLRTWRYSDDQIHFHYVGLRRLAQQSISDR